MCPHKAFETSPKNPQAQNSVGSYDGMKCERTLLQTCSVGKYYFKSLDPKPCLQKVFVNPFLLLSCNDVLMIARLGS